MIDKDIELTPNYWAQPDKVKYSYVSPQGTLWNVDRIVGDYVQLWTINAWGSVHHESVNIHQFRNTWREYK